MTSGAGDAWCLCGCVRVCAVAPARDTLVGARAWGAVHVVALEHVGVKEAQIALVPLIIVTGVCMVSAAHYTHHRVM